MHTVHASPVPFHCEESNAPRFSRSAGHADELSPVMLDAGHSADEWAELQVGLEEYTRDRIAQDADDAHAAALRGALSYAKGHVGTVAVKLSRTLTLDADGTSRVNYAAFIDGRDLHHIGAGFTPREAVGAALKMLDDHELAEEFGGYRVKGLAFVGGFPHRPKGEAMALARRIACDASYLDVAVSYALPGVADLRHEPAAPAALVA